ncbi:putative thiamine biosynthesis protein ThiS [Terrihabitans soli]|uniref:Putative thiamine biosynthesis protein ThiS n=1 Tax=Terrihabitans soli TaxID=708113 RepID=A0A6S6QVF0_9HYPH|nr:sulfur carrier protein ThiS [Terrihabitans soli]BCJ91061.1 putative thiamine biosynthesis protein ThiS [Terrihabitans soli]
MELTINGQAKTIEAANIAQLLAAELEEGHSQRGIAVAVNGEVVPKTQWETARIHAGDRVEIVRALPGG